MGYPEHQFKHTLPNLMRSLATRHKRDVRVLHFVSREGRFLCLDFNLSGDTFREIVSLASEAFHQLGVEEILPAASEEEWARIWHHEIKFLRHSLGLANPLTGRPVWLAMVEL